ncbi:MAG: cation-translocating P-type ATPase [Bacillota bacterium]|nr:cation-translocating P-type ATPase [Bacillota bacterium]
MAQRTGMPAFILNTGPKGLTHEEAELRLEQYGPNELHEAKKVSALAVFFNQFKDFIILVLLCATVVSFFIGEIADAITIVIIVMMNALLGFIQEYRTERSMRALKELSAPVAKVVRSGVESAIPAKQVVPGDLLVLEAGSRVAADSVLFSGANIQVNESILTGESVPVEKSVPLGGYAGADDISREYFLFMGTTLTSGRGKAIVMTTGMDTEMGKIAHLLQSVKKDETPLKKRLNKIGRILVFVCLGACALIALAGVIHGESIYNMFFSAISLAVAAIPEGLPTIVTVSLAIGVQRMLKRNALVRKLPAVETLGSVNIICSDKTGTLTENRMTVKKIYSAGRWIELTGAGSDVCGEFLLDKRVVSPKKDRALQMLLTTGVLCNNAVYRNGEAVGDPTEAAILIASVKGGMQDQAISDYSRVFELPFDSERKRMSVICKDKNGGYSLFVKGAPDNILGLCTRHLQPDGVQLLGSSQKNAIAAANEDMAGKALRVLAFAYAELSSLPARPKAEDLEKNLVFVGLEGMIDPPRKEAIEAVRSCYRAGIRPVMITGDHKNTAVAVACELGMGTSGQAVLTGEELEKLSDRELEMRAPHFSVYARVSPKHKLRIIRALKKRGNIIAMTGDGVNDAPALREADIGVAMGKNGTDCAKEASSMVLLDDNFATIVAAVEEGRTIYDNIRKSLRYLLSCNFGEIFMMGVAAIFGMAVPLIPIQILWINLVTDGFPAIALGLDPPEKDIMSRPPRASRENIFSGGLGASIFLSGILIGGSAILSFCTFLLLYGNDIPLARTGAFAAIIIAELLYAFKCRLCEHSALKGGLFKNGWLVLAVLVSFALMLMVMYVPFLSSIFRMILLDPFQWLIVISFSLVESVFGGILAFFFGARKPKFTGGKL